ncbi:MAG: FAD-dependent monooxygenase [Proteobacteria bacterium]|nr:FAD-dependent monooxygenase [Pseudomonadota bacterium]
MNTYEVIIIGGGPVGVALGIELGLQNIKTLILEKYNQPLHSTRAQSLSARTMEFMLRWKIDKELEKNILLPLNYPQHGLWCSHLNGETYYSGSWGDNELDLNCSPKQGVRIPLWVTEEVLQARLNNFPSIHFLKNQEVLDIKLFSDCIEVITFNKLTQKNEQYRSVFLAACDGAKGISKEKLHNPFKCLSDKTKILCINFTSQDLQSKKTVADGIFYWILSEEKTAFLGPIDLSAGIWFVQIICDSAFQEQVDEAYLSALMNRIVGFTFQKHIIDFHFWDMQVQLADYFSLENRVFWLGDAVHAFAPTGGLGLNTGFGDAVNLGWKLASVIKKQASASLLTTYEQERRPVCLANLDFARQSAVEVLEIKKKYPPEKNYKAFAQANAELGKRFLSTSGLTMGYAYLNSSLTQKKFNDHHQNMPDKYIPKADPGHFLPHKVFQDRSLYETLSPVHWNLLVSSNLSPNSITSSHHKVIPLANNTYPHEYLLVRPDWHIAQAENKYESLLTVNHLLSQFM